MVQCCQYTYIKYTIFQMVVICMICTFFGHRDAPKEIEPVLKLTLLNLVENHNVYNFYVGNNGQFDATVKNSLYALKQRYKHINYTVVLAYLPTQKQDWLPEEGVSTIYPEGLEKVPLQYAISKRNEWMISQANYVVTYVRYKGGGAAKFKELAERKGKIVINLAEFL